MNIRSNDCDSTQAYVLGHSDRELARLGVQARVSDPITRRFFREAGLAPGMRVLDVGSGAGDVAFLAADLVGESGTIVGVDRSLTAVEKARTRADAGSRRNVFFLEGDPADMTFDEPFDAVIGRFVLPFQPDPAHMLRKLAGHLRPGGLIVFHESDIDGYRSSPPSPIYDTCCRWIVETGPLADFDARTGMKLHSHFVSAGLPAPSMRLEAVLGGDRNGLDCLRLVEGLVDILSPHMVRLGIATAEEIGLETLMERMTKEALARGSVIVGRFEIGAWTRV
jgi:SAM-dependent methyltransferase